MDDGTLDHRSADDATLLAAVCAEDDPVAFEVLLDRYEAAIYRFVLRMVGDRHRAEDLTQDVFVRMYRQASSFDPARRLKTWLYAIARNVAINELRDRGRLKRRKVKLSGDLTREGVGVTDRRTDGPETPLSEVLKDEARRMLVAALETLKPHHRAALVLREYDQMPYEEIAEVLEASLASVKSWIHRGRAHLAAALAELGVTR